VKIDFIVCPSKTEDKLESKHKVTVKEARQVLLGKPRCRFAEKGYIKGNDVYVAFGRTYAGRYLSVFYVYKNETRTAIIISARDMSIKEKKSYGRK